MKNRTILLKAIFVSTTFAISSMAMAIVCPVNQMPICYLSSDVNSMPEDKCVLNASASAFLINSPDSIAGDCSQFDIKKIKTYACNAGLRFVQPTTDICIRYDQENTISSTCGDSKNCVCNFSNAANDLKVSYFNFGIAPYTGIEVQSFINKTLNASTTNEYAMASTLSGSQILQDASSLQFNFGSDFYGAEYLVDLCITNKNINASRFDLELTGRLLFANSIFNKSSYINASSLYNKIDLSCTDSSGGQIAKNLISDSPILTAERTYSQTVQGSSNCIVRHNFKENAKDKVRENNFKKVTFQTNITIAPSDESLLIPPPMTFCKIKPTKPKKYSCQSWKSLNTQDIISGGFIDANTYTGACPIPCKLPL